MDQNDEMANRLNFNEFADFSVRVRINRINEIMSIVFAPNLGVQVDNQDEKIRTINLLIQDFLSVRTCFF